MAFWPVFPTVGLRTQHCLFSTKSTDFSASIDSVILTPSHRQNSPSVNPFMDADCFHTDALKTVYVLL